jgi:hypothetical protein
VGVDRVGGAQFLGHGQLLVEEVHRHLRADRDGGLAGDRGQVPVAFLGS